jgi:hypothetical protein
MPGFGNASIDSLKPTTATLTRTDLVSFGATAK